MASFKIISVTGAHSGVGKTSLCALLFEYFKGFGAIKFSKTDLYASVIDDPDSIHQKGKDTAILSGAGAERVAWVQCPPEELEHSLDIAFGKMQGLRGVIIEGNSPREIVKPDVTLFVIGNDGEIKQSALPVMQIADVIVHNASTASVIKRSVRNLIQQQASVFKMNIKEKSGEIDKFIAHVKKYVL